LLHPFTLLIPSGRGEAGTLPVMAFKDGRPVRPSSRAHCEKIPRPRIHLSRSSRVDLVTPPPLIITGFPFPLPIREHGRNGNIGVEKASVPGKNPPGAV